MTCTLHQIPICPFSQRLSILVALKGQGDALRIEVVDITRPRDPALLALTDGATALPVLVTPDGTVLRESLVLMRYLDDSLPGPRIAQADPQAHAVESLLVSLKGEFTRTGYGLLMNRERERREPLTASLLEVYARLDAMLLRYGDRSGPWLMQRFGWAEAAFTPLLQRFWCLEHYEGFELPSSGRFARVHAWREACLTHPAAQQVSRAQIVRLYADYAWGAGNGALLPGRARSSFVFEPDWPQRPWPPRDKYGPVPSDAALGLLPA
jgi:glutathione S-transferase